MTAKDIQARLRRSRKKGGSWRRALAKADGPTQEAWAMVAYGHEGQGMFPEAAEYLAWCDIQGIEPREVEKFVEGY